MLSGPTPAFRQALTTLVAAANGLLLRLLPRQRLIDMTARSLHIPAAYRDLVDGDLQKLTPDLYRHINRANGAMRLPRHPTPGTLVVVGEREPTISRRHAARIGATVAGVVAYQVQGVGHGWNLEAPELFNQTLRAWLADAPLPAALVRLNRG